MMVDFERCVGEGSVSPEANASGESNAFDEGSAIRDSSVMVRAVQWRRQQRRVFILITTLADLSYM